MNPKTAQAIVDATRGSQIGAIIACALNLERDATPRFTSKAIITSDGFLQANFVNCMGETKHGAFIGSYEDLKVNMKSVQEYIRKCVLKQVSEGELSELWNAVVYDWIASDYRS